MKILLYATFILPLIYREAFSQENLVDYSTLLHNQAVYMNNGFLPYRENDKWGFVNGENEVFIQPQYDSIYQVEKILSYVIARNEDGLTVFNQYMEPVFDRPIEQIYSWGYDREGTPESVLLKEQAEKNGVSYIGSTEKRAGEIHNLLRIPTELILTVTYTNRGDSTDLHVRYRDGSVFSLSEKCTSFYWHFPCYVSWNNSLTRPNESKAGCFNLYTRKYVNLPGVPGTLWDEPFYHDGKEYVISTNSSHKAILKDGSGKELRRFEHEVRYINGFLAEFLPGENYLKKRYAITDFSTGRTVGAEPFTGMEFHYGFLSLTDAKGNFAWYNEEGDTILAGNKDTYYLIYEVGTTGYNKDRLLNVQMSNGKSFLLASDGKKVAEIYGSFSSRGNDYRHDYNSRYFRLFYGNYMGIDEPFTEKYAAYHPATQSLTILDYPEMQVIEEGKLLVKDSFCYRIVDDYGKIVDSLPFKEMKWVGCGEGGILVGGNPETDPFLMAEKKKAYDKVQIRNEFSEIMRFSYFDKKLNPLLFPGEYVFYSEFGMLLFAEAKTPALFGAMNEKSEVIVPQKYHCIQYDPYGDYFIVVDQYNCAGYIRGDGTVLFRE